jgi:hypothetical protein
VAAGKVNLFKKKRIIDRHTLIEDCRTSMSSFMYQTVGETRTLYVALKITMSVPAGVSICTP